MSGVTKSGKKNQITLLTFVTGVAKVRSEAITLKVIPQIRTFSSIGTRIRFALLLSVAFVEDFISDIRVDVRHSLLVVQNYILYATDEWRYSGIEVVAEAITAYEDIR